MFCFQRFYLGITLLLLALPKTTTSFLLIPSPLNEPYHIATLTNLFAAKSQKKKKKNASSGGGFGASKGSTSSKTLPVPTVSADKNSLEKQWDTFASITDLEIKPKMDPDDDNYIDFQVADIFVRCGETPNSTGTKWYRIGKVCTSAPTPMDVSLTLQKGLIFWTAVHMRRELVAAGGKSGAASLELGYVIPATLNMGTESDGPVDEDEEEFIKVATRTPGTSLKGIQSKSFGFRPDWNPPGFTYKRREKAAMKKKVSKLEEMKEVA